MSNEPHIVIVGASLSGLRTAEQIALADSGVKVTVVGDEPFGPYNRPPLSKSILTHKEADQTDRSIESALAEVRFKVGDRLEKVSWSLNTHVEKADLHARRLLLREGPSIEFDGLVIATGLRPRRLTLPGAEADRYVLRTLDEAITLRSRLRECGSVCIVGAGLIGCEIATSARQNGCAVTVIEPFGRPMERAIGPQLSCYLQKLHESRGVSFILNDPVEELVEQNNDKGRIKSVLLESGTSIECDLVVEAIGSHPNVEWLVGNGINLIDGVETDNKLAADETGAVIAVGDIARFPNPRFDDVPRRVEHWCMPGYMAKRGAQTITEALRGGLPSSDAFRPLPSFWSDQCGLRIQSFGMPGLADEFRLVEGTFDETCSGSESGPIMAAYRSGFMVGVIGVGVAPARLLPFRHQIGIEDVNPVAHGREVQGCHA